MVTVFLASLGRSFNLSTITSRVAAAVFRFSFVSLSNLLFRSTRELRAAWLFLDTRLSDSQWPASRRVSTAAGLWSIDILLGIFVLRTFLQTPLLLRLRCDRLRH